MPIRLSGINSGMDTEEMIKKIMDAERMKLHKIDGKKTKLQWKQEKWKELNKKLYSLYTDKVSALRLDKSYATKSAKSSNDAVATAETEAHAPLGNHSLQVKQLASADMLTGAKIADGVDVKPEAALTDLGFELGSHIDITVGNKTKSLFVNGDTTVEEFVKFAKESGLNANFDSTQKRFYLSSKESGAKNSFTIQERTNTGNPTAGLEKLGLVGAGVTRRPAQDAIFKLNGVEYTSESNDTTVNGIKLKLQGTTEGYGTASEKSISIGVNSDVEGVYKAFKAFIKEYNDVLKEMNTLFYADSAKGYEPLTEDEKKKMTDKDVEKWEGKIKDSLLRKDESLGAVLNGMKSAMSRSVEVNGKSFSLASFGVMTSKDYHEKGLLHIFGDKEDSTYSDKEDKLKKALAENPEEATAALKGIMDGLYKKMTDAMKGTSLSSAMTFYNDKEYGKLTDNYKKQYKDMETKINAVEDRYYKQFAAMEKALAKLNSQNGYLAGLLGR